MLLRALLLLAFTLGCCAGHAAEAEPEAEAAETPAAAAEGEASADDSDTEEPAEAAGSLDGEGFVPSVQISEDLSVSFPTDI